MPRLLSCWAQTAAHSGDTGYTDALVYVYLAYLHPKTSQSLVTIKSPVER